MKKFILILPACLLFCLNASAAGTKPSPPAASLTFRETAYHGTLSEDEARFTLDIDADATGASSAPLFEGDVAVLPAKLPDALKIVRDGNHYELAASRSGHFKFQLEIVAKIVRAEPWNQISFTGPVSTISSVTAQAAGTDTEVQLLNGTLLKSTQTNGISSVVGFLGADQTVSLRWQAKVAQVSRKVLLTVDSTIAAQVTPTVIKYMSKFHYDVVQGSAAELTLTLPVAQSLTRLDGEEIRDWHLAANGNSQTLTVEFIKPVENSYDLTLYSEQPVENAAVNSSLNPPQPQNVERESGSLTVSAEDTLVEITAPAGLRQVNAPGNAIAAYEFNARPLTLALALKPIEPVVNVSDRVTAHLEETRLMIAHDLSLDVEKAGIYTLELAPQPGFAVADVHGDGVTDWNVSNGKILVNFSSRVLGSRQLNVQLEEALKNFPGQIGIAPLRVTRAAKETAQIGVASAPGIRLRTGTLLGLREIPVNRLQNRSDEILAYTAGQPDWNLSIASEQLAPRIVADVFNLVTVGDGIVGGSATIRYSIVNQGLQEFKVRVPSNFKNVDFTGPNIRRKEQTGDVWTIGLQDKAWGAYTLVVTYDYQFDPKGATLPVGGIHAADVERETGSIAVTTAANLQLSTESASEPLRRIDETELSEADRSLITRAVVLAWQYTGSSRQTGATADSQYDLAVNAKQFPGQPVLEAIADRTQITSVLTDAGEMLTQASFMVKNNEKQFQRFLLPANSKLWGCYVNGLPAKPERDGDWILVSLPHDTDRDQAFAVDITYAQTNSAFASKLGKSLQLQAPRTDIPNTYAEWKLFAPVGFRLSQFGGSMNVAQGTTYGLLDAWTKFLAFYGSVLREAGHAILFIGFLAFLVITLVVSAVRRGWNGFLTMLGVIAMLTMLSAMLLPALASAKRKAQRINSVNNLKEVGLAALIFANDNNNRLPFSFDEMKNELGTDKITYDPENGQRYVYLGNGMSLDTLKPDSVIAYSPLVKDHCEVLYADGSVSQVTAGQFGELSQRGFIQLATPQEIAGKQQREAIARSQLNPPAAMPTHTTGINGGNTYATITGGIIATNGLLMNASEVTPFVPAVAGIRSIHIQLPETGQPFLFTKILNIRDEPLSVGFHIMPLRTFETMQMMWQTAAFLFGLALWWRQWRRENRNTFILAVALALVIGSVCSLLVQWRALHDALIIGFPAVVLAIIAFVIWKYWPRGGRPESIVHLPPLSPASGTPPVLAIIALLLALSLTSVTAAKPKAQMPANEINNASIVSADYSGTANDRVASLDATLRFSSARPGQIVPLFGSDVAIQQFDVKDGRAELVRNGDNVSVLLEGNGNATLQIKMLVKVAGDVTKRKLVFGIPPALSSRVAIALDEAAADVDFPTAISFQHLSERNKTQVEAVIGSGNQVELLWTPRVKRAEEIAATVFCRDNSLITFGNGVVNIRATMDYQITQGELRQARVRLPDGQKLLRVTGNGIRTWTMTNENGGQILVVDLLKGASPSWQLTLELERNLDALPASVAIAVPHPLDVKRETGLIGLRSSDDLGLSVESASGLQRVDAGEFGNVVTDQAGNLFSVFRFSKPDFDLRTRVSAIQPEIEAVARNTFRVSAERILLSSKIDYTIKRAGVFSLNILLPDGYRLDHVGGENVQQQNERNENGARILEITLKDRTGGAYALNLELAREFKELPKVIAVAGVHPLGTAKLNGFISVSADPGIAVKTDSFDGLTEIPATALPDYANVAGTESILAYKYISPEPKAAPEWKLSLSTESVAAWVRAEVVNTISLSETLASGRAQIHYNIANAPLKELRVRVPEDFQNVEISGVNIRSREQKGNIWHVELQNPASHSYTLTVTWEQPLPAKTNAFNVAGISADGVERETGLIAISAKASLQISESRSENLQRSDISDFPDWATAPDKAATLVYRYVRPDYQLSLNTRRLDDAEVLQAIVDSAQLTSVVANDGQMMTRMALSLRNNGRQFLEVALPAGAKVWSAFVSGEAVRPALRDGKLLLPVGQSDANDGAIPVELTYVETNKFPRTDGRVGFVSPGLDMPLKNARWELYLPPDYDYKDFSGTMMRETTPAPDSGTSSFSMLDYSRMEQANKSEAKIEVMRDVDEAQKKLDLGDVRGANATFNRAKWQSDTAKDGNGDIAELEKNLQKAAASNLIIAQNNFATRNAGISSAQLNYDDVAAGEQWTKLQQAQEIVNAKVRPLHVNLPVRGLRYAFTQVLQTEAGKPMTVQLSAANEKAPHWLWRGAVALGLFALLWILVGTLSRVNPRPKAI